MHEMFYLIIYFLKFTSEKLLSSGPHVLYSIGLSQFLLTGWGHNVQVYLLHACHTNQ